MALDTKQIERLIADRTEALRLEATDAVGEVSDAVRDLLVEIAVLKHLRRGGDQIAEYDAMHQTTWSKAFVAASSNNDLRRFLKNSPAARLQRLFTHPDQRVRPRIPRENLNDLPLDGFIIHPDRIPGSLLVKTGLIREEELHGLNGDEIGRLIVKYDCIPSVKALFQAATPIGPKQGRILRINQPTDAIRSQYPDATAPKHEAIGAILYVRGKQNGDRASNDLIVQFFDGSYDALRKTYHAESNYDAEIDALAECQRDLDGIRLKLDRGYRRDAPAELKQRLYAQAESVIARVELILRNAQATEKVEARTFASQAMEQRTKTGKPNVSPMMAKMTAALKRIDNRFAEIRSKGGYNAEDRIILQERISGDERTLLTTRHDVIDCAKDIDATRTTVHAAYRMLQLHMLDLERVRIRPLSVFASAMLRQLQTLDPKNTDLFREQILRLHVVGKLQGIRTSAERIRHNAAKYGEIDYAAEARIARHVETVVREKQISPDMRIDTIAHVMKPVVEQWAAVGTFLEMHAATQQDDPSQTQDALEELLNNLGTECAAEALVSWLPEAIQHTETPGAGETQNLTNNSISL